MSFLSSIFGSAPKVQTVPATFTSSLDPSQQSAESTLVAALGGAPSAKTPPYSGELSAPLSPLQSSSLAAISGAVGPAGTAAQDAGGAQGSAESTLQQILQGGPQDFTQYYKTNVLQPLQQNFQETTLPSIVSALGGSLGGPQSTAASTAVSKAAQDFGSTLAATTANLGYNTAEQNVRDKLGAAGLTPSVTQAPINTLQGILSAGAVPQATQQTADVAAFQNYLTQQGFTQQDINNLLNLISSKTQAQNQVAVTSGQSGILGGLAGSAGVGNAVGSGLSWLGSNIGPAVSSIASLLGL